MSDDYEARYTKPKLRRNLKKKIMAGKKGGRRGTWSARKAQILVKKYESKGGGYKTEKTDTQKSLENWTAQDWQTLDGSGDAEKDGEMRRYLPAKIWTMLSSRQQERAEKTKIRKDRRGRQFADWPDCVYSAMTAAGLTSDSPKTIRKKRLRKFASRLGLEIEGSESNGDLIRFIADAGEGEAKSSKPKDSAPASKQSKAKSAKSAKPSEPKKDLQSLTKDELYEMAQERDVPGRSKMNKDELVKALS